MTRLLWLRAIPFATLVLWAIAVGGATARAQRPGTSNSKSWTDTVVSPFKQGFDKLGHALTPKPSAPKPGPEDDAISLKSKAKPGPDLYVAVAQLYEQSGNLSDAEAKYQLALKEKPDHLAALLGYAHLKERAGKPDEAIEIYRRAAKAHPREAAVHNNLGLCYARQNQPDDAVAALKNAVQLDPRNPRYRNNIATVLIDQGNPREAYAHLREVHQSAAAYYNMGYLLNKKGQTQAALHNFSLALRADPSMTAARRWAEHLQKTTTQARLPNHPAASGLKITREPTKPPSAAPLPPDRPAPRRLPSTTLPRPETVGPTVPGISYRGSSSPVAPLPPVTPRAALRPLPRVN